MFQDHSVAELLDWKPTRSPEVEAQNEIDDVQQMIDAQNELRRKRGAKEITEADVQRQAQEDQAMRARGRGPFAEGGGTTTTSSGAGPDRRLRLPRPGARASGSPRMAGRCGGRAAIRMAWRRSRRPGSRPRWPTPTARGRSSSSVGDVARGRLAARLGRR